MNKNINGNKGFLRSSLLLTIAIVIAALFLVSCSGSDEKNIAIKSDNVAEADKDISDSSMEFSGLIAQTTCLDCHPAIKDGGFDIDFSKVKEAGMIIDKGQDVIKEDKKKSEK